jgi:hypothetical protein
MVGEEAWTSVAAPVRVDQGKPFQVGTWCWKMKHAARCQQAVADPRKGYLDLRLALGRLCTPLLVSLAQPSIPRRRFCASTRRRAAEDPTVSSNIDA